MSPFVRDLAFTTLTSLATILALIVATRVAAEGLGPEGFGAYMLSRRILSAIDPLSTLTMGIALTRFVAFDDTRAKGDYLTAGIVLAVVPAAIVLVLALSLATPLAELLFRKAEYAALIRATGFMVFGYSWFTVLYAWYRGVNRMSLANVWQLVAIALAPLVLACIFRRPGGETWIVMWTAVVLLAAAIPVLVELGKSQRHGAGLRSGAMRALADYALPRVPGGLASGGLLAVGPFISPYYGSLTDAGYLAVGQSVLRVIEGGTEAFGRVALPKMSRMMAAGGVAGLQQPTGDVVAVVFHLGLFVTLHLWLWTGEITRFWLGAQYAGAIPVIRVFVLALLPYLLFVTLRAIIDAIEEKAVNTVNLFHSLGVTVVTAVVLARLRYSAVALAVATAAGFTLLGTLTLAAVWRRCRFALGPLLIPECITLNVALVGAAAAARAWLYAHLSGAAIPVAGLLLEVLLMAAYGFGLSKMRPGWIDEVARRIVAREPIA